MVEPAKETAATHEAGHVAIATVLGMDAMGKIYADGDCWEGDIGPNITNALFAVAGEAAEITFLGSVKIGMSPGDRTLIPDGTDTKECVMEACGLLEKHEALFRHLYDELMTNLECSNTFLPAHMTYKVPSRYVIPTPNCS